MIICSCLISAADAFDYSVCQEKAFTVTAYYSPESGQVFYYKPSFQDEVILNGEWQYGASGKKVFNGMLAWPATYPFGSNIYFPGFGIGEVADRGGAIVLSWERGQSCDRIDIWMGNGEEGLIRALTFGKKNMTGYFCDSSILNISPKSSLLRNNVPVLKNFFDVALRVEQLEEWRNDIRTWTLQKYLVKLWYLKKKYRNGNYEDHTRKALCDYQVTHRIVSAKNPDCGTFWSATRYLMKLDMQNKWFLPKNLYATGTFASLIDFAKYYNGHPNVISTGNLNDREESERGVAETKTTNVFHFYRAYAKWQQSSEIRILQTFLQSQWFYGWAIDGIYSKMTTDAVYGFQKKYSLISDSDPLIMRGFLGPKTRSNINALRIK